MKRRIPIINESNLVKNKNINIEIVNKSLIKSYIIEILLIVWSIVIFYAFLINIDLSRFSYINSILFRLATIISVLILLLLIFFFLLSIFKPKVKKLILRFLTLKDILKINIKYLIILFLLITVIIPTLSVLNLKQSNYGLNFNDFVFFLFNICQKVIFTFLFYSILILFVYAFGRIILNKFKLCFNSKLEEFIFSVSLGFIPLIFGTFLLGILGWLYNPAVWVMIFLYALLSIKELRKIVNELATTKIILSLKTRQSVLKLLLFILLFIFLAINFSSLIKPYPVDNDSLHVYFNNPRLFVSYHEIVPFYNGSQANMYQNIEMLYTWIMTIFDASFIVHFSLLFLILFLVIIYLFTKQFFGENIALLVVLFSYFTPISLYILNSVKVIYALMFYSMIFIYSLFKLINEKYKLNYLVLLAVFGGLLFGIKFNAVFIIIPVIIIIIYFTYIKKIKLFHLVLFFLVFLLIIAPWALKNIYYFHNPFYPYSNFGFSQEFITQQQELGTSSSLNEYNQLVHKERTLLLHGVEYGSSIIQNLYSLANSLLVGNKYASPVILLLLPLIIFTIYNSFNKKEIRYLSILVSIAIILWTFKAMGRVWYAAPFYYLLYIFSAFSLVYCYKLMRRKYIYICLLIVQLIIIFLYFSVIPFTISTPRTSQFKYLIGMYTKEEFAKESIRIYEISEYINNNIINQSGENKILLTPDDRVAFIDRNDTIVVPDQFGDFFYSIAKDSSTVGETIQKMKDLEISHLLVNFRIRRHKKLNIANSQFYNDYYKTLYNVSKGLDKLKCTYSRSNILEYCLYKI